MKKTLIAAAMAAVATPALAQPLNVYDSRNQLIGLFEGNDADTAAHSYSGKVYLLEYHHKAGLQNNAVFLFPTANCSGQKYAWDYDLAPEIALYDGSSVWVQSGAFQTINIVAFSWGGTCYSESIPNATVSLMKEVDDNPNRWVPPFSVR